MKLSQFKFKLPEELVALYPHSIYREFENDNGEKETFRITRRDECRLMVLHKKSQTIEMYKKDDKGNPIEGEYLDFRNVRPNYLANFLDKLVNWDVVADLMGKGGFTSGQSA